MPTATLCPAKWAVVPLQEYALSVYAVSKCINPRSEAARRPRAPQPCAQTGVSSVPERDSLGYHITLSPGLMAVEGRAYCLGSMTEYPDTPV